MIPLEKIEGHVLDRLKGNIFTTRDIDKILRKVEKGFLAKVKDNESEGKDIDGEIQKRKDRIDALLDSIDSRHKDLINAKLDKLRAEIEDLKKHRQELERTAKIIDKDRLRQDIVKYAKDLKKVLKKGNTSEKKAIMRSCIESMVSDPLKREVRIAYYKLPKYSTSEPLYDYDLSLSSTTGTTPRRP